MRGAVSTGDEASAKGDHRFRRLTYLRLSDINPTNGLCRSLQLFQKVDNIVKVVPGGKPIRYIVDKRPEHEWGQRTPHQAEESRILNVSSSHPDPKSAAPPIALALAWTSVRDKPGVHTTTNSG